jgi:Xaa-Pro dipeptidase
MSTLDAHLAELAKRWSDALTGARLDAALVAAGAPRNYFLDDQAAPFRPNPHFAQWLPGFDCPQSLLLVEPARKPRLFFYRPDDYWHAPPQTPDVGAAFELETHASLESLTEAAARAIERRNRVAFVGELPSETSNLPVAEHNPALLLNPLHYARARKTEFELDCMRRATAIAVAGHRAAEAAFRAASSEFDVHQAYLSASRQTEAELPYHNIVGQNEHAAVLHYQHCDRAAPRPQLSLLIDAGATHRGYAADITRTYAKSADHPFAQLIADLDACQQALIADIRPGLSYVDLHERMHRDIAMLLVRHRLVTSSAEAAFEERVTDAFFPHGLGHLLGLQVHDVGGHAASPEGGLRAPPARYPALRLTRRIEADQVFTIEPGIYFIPSLLAGLARSPAGKAVSWPTVDALRRCGGIRIEDNVCVRADGIENLTRDAFRAAR